MSTMETALHSKINISHEVLFQELDNEAILLNLRDDAYYRLDDVGTRLWQLFNEFGAVDPVVARMLAEYQVEEGQLRQDLSALLSQMQAAGVITTVQ